MKNVCGIYCIKNILDGKIYIGQSVNLNNRKSNHFGNLSRNQHSNIHLQRAYNKYGCKRFVFEVLLYCEPFELTKYEQFFIDQYKDSEILYNICLECVDSSTGIKWSKEACERRGGKNNPMWGKRGINSKKTASKTMVLNILKLLDEGLNQTETAKKLNINRKTVRKVQEGEYDKMYKLKKRNYKHNYGRISKDIVLNILELLDSGMTQVEIANILKISKTSVHRAKNGWYNKVYDLQERYYDVEQKNVRKKLTLEIIEKMKYGLKLSDIAEDMGISTSFVSNVKNEFFNDENNILDFEVVPYDRCGINNGMFLSKDKVLKVKSELNKNLSLREISRRSGVDRSTIKKIKSGYYDTVYDLPKINYKSD